MIDVDDKELSVFDAEGGYCASCGFWIHDVSTIYCEGCDLPICERCGKLDDTTGLFLCPDCFAIPASKKP